MSVKMSRGTLLWSTMLHATVLCHHAALVWGFAGIDLDLYEHPVVVRIKPFKFFTISGWCFQLQIHHAVLSLAAEWQHWRGTRRNTQKILKYERYKDIMFRGLVLPFTLLVSCLFWCLYWCDRELVYGAVWDEVVPSWLNHGVHSSTAAFTLLELALTRSGQGDTTLEATMYWALSLGYAALLNSVYVCTGSWLYPVQSALSWWQLVLFQVAVSLAGRALLQFSWRIDGVKHTTKVL